MTTKFRIISLILLFLLVSCSKRTAIGGDNIVLVLADIDVYEKYEEKLEQLFSKEIFTPVPEKRYYIEHVDLKTFSDKRYFKNILMLTDIDGNGKESEFINNMLPETLEDGIREGDYSYVFKKDIWAKKQNVLILMTSKEDNLSNYLETQGNLFYDQIHNRNLELVRESLFDEFNNTEAQNYTLENYNVDIFVPHDFTVVNEGKKTKFIRFRRFMPDRWLTIIWGDYDNSITFQENIINLRNQAGEEFGDKVKVNPEIIDFEPDNTFTENGVLIRGIWEYDLGGGPFFAHAFIKNNKLVLVDGAVFYPGNDKYPFIEQLELMAKSAKFK
ncbi:MAG: DUF4837 family protein [Candidatus Delongbacteria bacterium]|nr:DUF4837 family protein [Candidatus Delongbacteria bacterium]MBN2833417.1 DUF4837 family protein [Candidatus Delongbacteria bacterium]